MDAGDAAAEFELYKLTIPVLDLEFVSQESCTLLRLLPDGRVVASIAHQKAPKRRVVLPLSNDSPLAHVPHLDIASIPASKDAQLGAVVAPREVCDRASPTAAELAYHHTGAPAVTPLQNCHTASPTCHRQERPIRRESVATQRLRAGGGWSRSEQVARGANAHLSGQVVGVVEWTGPNKEQGRSRRVEGGTRQRQRWDVQRQQCGVGVSVNLRGSATFVVAAYEVPALPLTLKNRTLRSPPATAITDSFVEGCQAKSTTPAPALDASLAPDVGFCSFAFRKR